LIDEKLVNKLSDCLKKQKQRIATAESCTGGLLAHTLTNISGSSVYFERGIISYSDESKIKLLRVSEKTIKQNGAVSYETAGEMANGIRTLSKVDIGVSTTGIAGPTGGSKEKPVGLVYIGVSTSDKNMVERFNFSGDRLENKENTCNAALKMLLEIFNS